MAIQRELWKAAAILALALLPLCIVADDAKLGSFAVRTHSAKNTNLKASFRIPAGFNAEDAPQYRIMVLFGGRNWDSERTIVAFKFDKLADNRKLFLLSLSFKDDDYWEPERWSGKAMLDAIAELRKRYGLKEGELLYYGYSAGAQCANLFMAWKPEIVETWGCHACGVWCSPRKFATPVPAIITCGENDEGRSELSVSFVQSYRECGNPAILKMNQGGHELPDSALKLAEAFFNSVLSSPDKKPLFIGDDQRMKFFPVDSRTARSINSELRNEFLDETTAKLWQGEP